MERAPLATARARGPPGVPGSQAQLLLPQQRTAHVPQAQVTGGQLLLLLPLLLLLRGPPPLPPPP